MKNFHWPIRVYYEDTDAGGVVYYANYLKFFERARSERLRAMGFEQDTLMRREGVVFVVRRMEIDYLKPARFNDALTVSADFGPIKHASLTFHQSIARDDSGRCCTLCEAKVQIVCVDCDSLRPRPIPETLFRRINDDF